MIQTVNWARRIMRMNLTQIQTVREERKIRRMRKLEEVIKNMVVEEPIDWSKRRKEIMERMEKEENKRKESIEKAKRLYKTWELMRVCQEYIREHSNS